MRSLRKTRGASSISSAVVPLPSSDPFTPNMKDDTDTAGSASGQGISSTGSNAYLQKIQQKREQNEQRLKDLGLDNFKKSIPNSRRITPSKPTRTKMTGKGGTAGSGIEEVIVDIRRSRRKANKPVLYSGDEIDLLQDAIGRSNKRNRNNKVRLREDEEEKKDDELIHKPVMKKVRRKKVELDEQISEEKRIKLFQNVSSKDWVADMEHYFRDILENSFNNVQRVMNVVEKLVSGQGIKHPSTGAYFKKNKKIKLTDDFSAMLDEAKEWVDENGGDRGNGWLIEHPIKKCFVYQQERAEQTFKKI